MWFPIGLKDLVPEVADHQRARIGIMESRITWSLELETVGIMASSGKQLGSSVLIFGVIKSRLLVILLFRFSFIFFFSIYFIKWRIEEKFFFVVALFS